MLFVYFLPRSEQPGINITMTFLPHRGIKHSPDRTHQAGRSRSSSAHVLNVCMCRLNWSQLHRVMAPTRRRLKLLQAICPSLLTYASSSFPGVCPTWCRRGMQTQRLWRTCWVLWSRWYLCRLLTVGLTHTHSVIVSDRRCRLTRLHYASGIKVGEREFKAPLTVHTVCPSRWNVEDTDCVQNEC